MYPVVLIPGIGGSVLVKKSNIHKNLFQQKILDNRWINLYPFSRKSVRQWKEDMRYNLRFDPSGQRIIGFEGHSADIVPYDVGGTRGIKDLVPELLMLNDKQRTELENMYHFRYFHTMCEALYAAGYKDRETLVGMPYDFRLTLDPEYRRRLFLTFRHWIEKVGDKKPVVVVAHSLGAILFKWFLTNGMSDDWVARYIRSFVGVCAPFGGAPNSLKAALAGEHYIPYFHHVFREELQYNSGILMCLPNELGVLDEEIIYQVGGGGGKGAGGTKVRLADFEALADGGIAPLRVWRDLMLPHYSVLHRPIELPSAYSVVCCNVATGARFKTQSLLDYPYDTAYGYGDGVVPARSLKAFRKVFKKECVKELIIPDSNHSKLLSDARVIDLVLSLGLGVKG